MAVLQLSPSEIYFSQDSISNVFGQSTRHHDKKIGETLDDILLGKCKITDLPPIEVTKRRGLWVTADNRRLWIFKQLQMLGECEKISVERAKYIDQRKKFILNSTRLRRDAGGNLWKSRLSMLTNERKHTTPSNRNHQELENNYQAQASWKSILVTDYTRKAEVERSSELSFNRSSSRESTFSDYQGVRSVVKRAASTETPRSKDRSKDQDTPINFSNSTSTQSSYQTSEKKFDLRTQSNQATSVNIAYKGRAVTSVKEDLVCRKKDTYAATSYQKNIADRARTCILEQDTYLEVIETKQQLRRDSNIRGHTPDVENANQNVHSHKRTTEQQTQIQEKTITINPLDVKFAGNLPGVLSFNGNSIGEYFDKFFHFEPREESTSSLKVFEYQGKFYSEERLYLWFLQSIYRFSENFVLSVTVIPRPVNISSIYLCDSLKSEDRIGGEEWKKLSALNSLCTKKRMRLALKNILYSTNSIQDTFNRQSIIKKIIDVYSSKNCVPEINVVEFDCKFYALENKKLWVLKNAEVVMGPLTVTGNVKICMDYIMFHSFTSDNIREVDIEMDIARHTVEERFMLEYIRRKKTS